MLFLYSCVCCPSYWRLYLGTSKQYGKYDTPMRGQVGASVILLYLYYRTPCFRWCAIMNTPQITQSSTQPREILNWIGHCPPFLHDPENKWSRSQFVSRRTKESAPLTYLLWQEAQEYPHVLKSTTPLESGVLSKGKSMLKCKNMLLHLLSRKCLAQLSHIWLSHFVIPPLQTQFVWRWLE